MNKPASKPNIYSIAAHRGFADALVAGLLPRYRDEHFGLARLTLLLPSQRAVRTITEAFVRQAEGGLLLPRMAVIGGLDLDEALGPLLDPLGAGASIAPAADPVRRWFRLAHYLQLVEGDKAGKGASLLRRAYELGQTMDRLLVEGIAPEDLLSESVVGLVGDLAEHWKENTRTFLMVQQYWLTELAERGEIDAPARRNQLFAYASERWTAEPPEHPILGVGVTSASPALASLLRVIADMPQGGVVLPDLDLALDEEAWAELGLAGAVSEEGYAPFGLRDATTHPQYHLKVLLNRMGVARDEVRPWHRAGLAASQPERSIAISNLFLPSEASKRWVDLQAAERRLSGVRLMETANPEEEAQSIAILMRQALETPEKRVALITPDRGLSRRVIAQLQRWGISADDTAGVPLGQTAAGRIFLLLAEVLAENCAPIPLIALLTHPLVQGTDGRPVWLEQARKLDLALRGPRPAPGLEPLSKIAEKAHVEPWWAAVAETLQPLMTYAHDAGNPATEELAIATLLDSLVAVLEALCGEKVWSGADGRALASFVEDIRSAAIETDTCLDPREASAMLRDAMERQSVRPPWGGHPRVAIYGLLEARMARADVLICGGLVEGVWPGRPSADPLLPPAVLRALGVPGADFRIGLAAHDLAGALGAPEVILSYARRDAGAPVIPSRFILRIKALVGDFSSQHQEFEAVRLAREIDRIAPILPHPQPQPMPNAEQRKVDVSVTGLDRLRSDPYQFYANSILGLRSLDALDAPPSHAWKGTAAHAIMERWHEKGNPRGELPSIAAVVLDEMSGHPLMRSLWRPRLLKALAWMDGAIADAEQQGRKVIGQELWGEMERLGVRILGRADRIDRLADGSLAIIDYKTGSPPTKKAVAEGYSLQLAILGMIAEADGFKNISGNAECFEYWSFGRDPKGSKFGYVQLPTKDTNGRTGLEPEEFLPKAQDFLDDALNKWILGEEPFTARLNLDVAGYNDYDHLMRLDEWLANLPSPDAENRENAESAA